MNSDPGDGWLHQFGALPQGVRPAFGALLTLSSWGLNFFSLPRVDESVLTVLSAVQECHRYPITKLLREDRIGFDPKISEVLSSKGFQCGALQGLDRQKHLSFQQLSSSGEQCKAEINQSEADTAVMVPLPFFYSQEREDDVVTMPASHSPLSHHLQHQRNHWKLSQPSEHQRKPWRKPVRPQEKLANGQAQKVSPRIVTFDALPKPPSVGSPQHLLWKAAPKSKMARKSLEAQISQSTTRKALSRTPWNQECDQRPKPSKATALATPPKMPSRRDTLPACSPPPPRPSTSSEVWKVPPLQLEVVEMEELHWCGSCTPTTSNSSATSLPWKRSSKIGLPTNSHAWCASKGKQLPK